MIAVSSDNRVVSLGHIPLILNSNTWEKKEYLKGIVEQNGFIIYSTRDEPFDLDDSGKEKKNLRVEISEKIEDLAEKGRSEVNQQCPIFSPTPLQSPINKLREVEVNNSVEESNIQVE